MLHIILRIFLVTFTVQKPRLSPLVIIDSAVCATFVFAAGHAGVKGHEKADSLASTAAVVMY